MKSSPFRSADAPGSSTGDMVSSERRTIVRTASSVAGRSIAGRSSLSMIATGRSPPSIPNGCFILGPGFREIKQFRLRTPPVTMRLPDTVGSLPPSFRQDGNSPCSRAILPSARGPDMPAEKCLVYGTYRCLWTRNSKSRFLLTGMPDCTCLYIGPSNAVIECGSITAANSAEAMARMEHAIRSRADLTAIEIWREGRMHIRLTWADLLSRTG
jgi:hypothetical protein